MRFDGEWFRPSLLSVTLAGFAEAIVLAVQYQKMVEDVGMGVFRHYYWPWYVHVHGDNVVPPDSLPFALNFLTGVVLFLPLAQGLTWVLRRSERWPPAQLIGYDVLQPGLAKTALTLVGVVLFSLLGDSAAFNAFSLPGLLVTLGGLVLARAVLRSVQTTSGAWLALPYAVSLPGMWLLASWLWERRPGPLPPSVNVRRWLIGRDTRRMGEHLTVGVVASLGILVFVGAAVALEVYPEHAKWYEVSVVSATTLTAGTQAYRNDGFLVSWVLAAMLLGVFVFPNYALFSPYARYLDFFNDVVAFGSLLGTVGFVSGVIGHAIVTRKRAIAIQE